MANLAVMSNAVKRTARIDWAGVRRRTRWPGFKRELVIQRLLTCYGELTDFDKAAGGRWSNPKFMREFGDFADVYGTELVGLAAPHVPGPIFDAAKCLADKWGLKAPWAPGRIIREATVNVVRKRRARDEWQRYPLYIFPLVPIRVAHSDDSGADEMWRDRELDRNVRWTYQRHALRKTPKQIVTLHNKGEESKDEPEYLGNADLGSDGVQAVEEGIRTVSRMIDLEPTYTR
jgi:hypothetical protein